MGLVSFLILFLSWVMLCATQTIPMSVCVYGRVTGGYVTPGPAFTSGVNLTYLDGTCHYSNAQPNLPSWYANGFLAAPDDETYNGFPWTSTAETISGVGVGKSCGECFELTGDTGTITIMVADVCNTGCCANCQGSLSGDIPDFDLNGLVYSQMTASNTGGVPIAYRKVTCDMSSIPSAGVMFGLANEGTFSVNSFRLRVFGATVGITSVEVQGSVAGATAGNWVALNRIWEGGWTWTLGDIGAPFSLRVTSILNDTLTLPSQITAAQIVANAKFMFNAQFTSPSAGYGGSSSSPCIWPGPPPDIYIDALSGDNFVFWRDYGSYTTSLPVYNSTTNCFSGNCISVGPSVEFTAMQIGYSAGVGAPSTYYTSFQFYVMSPATATFNVFWTGSVAVLVTTTTSWQLISIPMSNFYPTTTGSLQTVQFEFTANTTSTVYFDNLQLIGNTVPLLIRVASPLLAGPPPVGFSGYTVPSVCCIAINGTTAAPTPETTNPPSTTTTPTPEEPSPTPNPPTEEPSPTGVLPPTTNESKPNTGAIAGVIGGIIGALIVSGII